MTAKEAREASLTVAKENGSKEVMELEKELEFIMEQINSAVSSGVLFTKVSFSPGVSYKVWEGSAKRLADDGFTIRNQDFSKKTVIVSWA
jgi:hypothetical protein